jgi:hypothetical protein
MGYTERKLVRNYWETYAVSVSHAVYVIAVYIIVLTPMFLLLQSATNFVRRLSSSECMTSVCVYIRSGKTDDRHEGFEVLTAVVMNVFLRTVR